MSLTYTYDAHGSMTTMPHLQVMEWDYADRLKHTRPLASGTDQDTYFTYDSAGERARKVFVASGTVVERIYLGSYEVYRERPAIAGSAVALERQTLHVMDDSRRVSVVETKTISSGALVGVPTHIWRFQLDNHLGSAMVELDETGAVIAYEEYHPYGSTAFSTTNGNTEVSAKRYRYTGKEKDVETGLYYHGARYYASWLGRWTAADPSGVKGTATELYEYCHGNPITLLDPDGRDPTTDKTQFVKVFNDRLSADPSTAHAQTLLQAFRDNGISGGTAKERLQSILTLTRGRDGQSSAGPGPYLHFNEVIRGTGTDRAGRSRSGDSGFRRELRDSIQYHPNAAGKDEPLSPASSDQIGHFLTAAEIGLTVGENKAYVQKAARDAKNFEKEHPFKAILGDLLGGTTARMKTQTDLEAIDTVYLRAAIGHELVPDGSVGSLPRSVAAPSPADIQNFLAGRLDLIKITDTPKSGNSYQDLLLTFIGFKFGEKVANNEFASAAEAGRYLELMLTDRDLSTIAKTDPFYKDVQELQGLLKQFKEVQGRIHPPPPRK